MDRVLALVLMLVMPAAFAARLEIPLRVPLEVVERALASQLEGEWREGTCRFLKLESPSFEVVDGRLKLVAPGSAALGIELGGQCRNAAAWEGEAQFVLQPRMEQSGKLRMQIVDSQLVDMEGKKAATLIWELGKRQLHPRLERFAYDVGNARESLTALARSVPPVEQRPAMEQAVAQMQLLEPRVEGSELVVPLALEVPDAWLAAPTAVAATAPAVPLTEAEMEALEKALAPWDAFLVSTIRRVAKDSGDLALRQRLFTLLLESRYALVAILSGDERPTGDPVRALFIDTWSELRQILADAKYTLLVDAGEALLALDKAAPGLGLQVSADGLRQLARNLPGGGADALAYTWDVDSELRGLFGVSEPQPVSTSYFSFSPFIKTGGAARSIDGWIPVQDQLAAYESRVADLLRRTAIAEAQRAGLNPPYDRIYDNVVPTTALIESCWKQFVVRNGKALPLRSGAGSVGMMQINQHVWRGFYDIEKVRWDPAYNARAGAQILLRYMKDYAIPYAEKIGDPNAAPRAVYAVYNAGPKAVGRFAKTRPHPREKRVDDKLWTLYQGIAAGGHADLVSCGVTSMQSARQ